MDQQGHTFIGRLIPQLAELEKQSAEAYWKATTVGHELYERQYSELQKRLRTLLANKELFDELKRLKDSELHDSLLKRQIDILYNRMLPNQISYKAISELVQKEVEIEKIFTHFRATYEGKKISDNEINEILQTEADTYKRKRAWYASKQIGEVVQQKLIALVKHRNNIARQLGFRDFYQMKLATNEIDEDALFALLDELKQETDQPYADIKNEADKLIAKQFDDLRPEGLRPWHYYDPFCQEAPPVFAPDLNAYFEDKQLEEIATAFYSTLGMDVSDVLARSDLYEREKKYQHAYCTDIDREGDVRILCNLRPNEQWMDTLLHELGHAVYDKYIDRDLPYILRQPAHLISTEAIAIMMGRLTKNVAWLQAYVGIPDEQSDELGIQLMKQQTLSQLVFLRWCLVMIYFERDLYANPDQDLNRRWWHYVESLQFIPCPEARNKPDWAAKIHLSVAPAYYQNYLLGELMAAQLWATMKRTISENDDALIRRAETGEFLKERIFKHGKSFHWNDLLKQATEDTLNPDHFINQVTKVIEQHFDNTKKKPEKRPAKQDA